MPERISCTSTPERSVPGKCTGDLRDQVRLEKKAKDRYRMDVHAIRRSIRRGLQQALMRQGVASHRPPVLSRRRRPCWPDFQIVSEA